ncbi:MAG: hypothetical protein HC821_00040 [Lewinella sp.]|nr:hypothetical protein [Lewinella sp.]
MDINLKDAILHLPVLDGFWHSRIDEAVLEGPLDKAPPANWEMLRIPYQTHLCLSPLIDRIEATAQTGHPGEIFLAQEIMTRVGQAPELRNPVTELALFTQHQETIELMMLFLLPAGQQEALYFKLGGPFQIDSVYSSPALQALLNEEEVCYSLGEISEHIRSIGTLQAGLTILSKCYHKSSTSTSMPSLKPLTPPPNSPAISNP